jgi:hypothetical protein
MHFIQNNPETREDPRDLEITNVAPNVLYYPGVTSVLHLMYFHS